jgi:hypothetical protein
MNESVLVVFGFWQEVVWTVPAIGFVVACCAFIWGRRLVGRPKSEAPPAAPPAPPPVDVFLHGSARERRSAPRRAGNTVEIALSRGAGQLPVHGWVVNRSVGGLCLMVDEPVQEGASLQVRPRTASDATPWIPVEIRSCQPGNGSWEVHCRFLQTPQYNILLLFG